LRRMLIQTVKNLFSPPETVKYPQEPSPPPPDYRGLILYKEELCIFCTKCEMVCPPGAIKFTYSPDGKKKFHYNPYLCIYCGGVRKGLSQRGVLGSGGRDRTSRNLFREARLGFLGAVGGKEQEGVARQQEKEEVNPLFAAALAALPFPSPRRF